jgi:hypothetical protein
MRSWPLEWNHIFSRLRSVRRYNDFWKAKCPQHDDEHPSLAIAVDRKGLVLKCHANRGCTFRGIVQCLGLRPQDFFADRLLPWRQRKRRPVSTIVKTYDYRDESNILLYQEVRYDPKDFRVRRPKVKDPRDDRPEDWVDNAKGVRLVLYRLPELLAAPPQRTIFVVEGAKSADYLAARLELVTTTNPFGAGKWKEGYSEALRGRKVVILPDHDPVDAKTGYRAGWRHAVNVANNLYGIAASVKVLDLPGLKEGQDADDWVNGFGEAPRREILTALANLVQTCPEWVPRPLNEQVTSPFLKALDTEGYSLREEVAGVHNDLEALGILRKFFLNCENRFAFGGRDRNPRGTAHSLLALAAACRMVAEDLGLVGDAAPGATQDTPGKAPGVAQEAPGGHGQAPGPVTTPKALGAAQEATA